MLKTKTISTLTKQMILKVILPNALALEPYNINHVCKNSNDEEFSFNVLSFEWNAAKTEAEVHAILCNETGENIKKDVSYLLQYNYQKAEVVVKEIYP